MTLFTRVLHSPSKGMLSQGHMPLFITLSIQHSFSLLDYYGVLQSSSLNGLVIVRQRSGGERSHQLIGSLQSGAVEGTE